MNICRVGQNGSMLVSSRFFFSCMARFFAGLFFDVFFGFFFMQSRRLEQLQPAWSRHLGYSQDTKTAPLFQTAEPFLYMQVPVPPTAVDLPSRPPPAERTRSGTGISPKPGSQRRNET